MLTITLLCSLGMSTSLLVDKMVDYAKTKGIEVDVDALPYDKADDRLNRTDILLLGPQVRYLLKKFQKDFGDKIPVIEAMNMSDYALLKADKILNEALLQLKTNRP